LTPPSLHDALPIYIHPLSNGWAGQVLAGLEEMLDFPENPRITNGSTANHDAIHLILHTPSSSLFHAVHIAVAENRDTDARIAFDLTDQVPVGLPLIHLRAGTAMGAQRLNPHIL